MWKFKPILKTTLWGGNRIIPFKGIEVKLDHVGESWEISGVTGEESVVEGGEDAGLTLSQLIDRHEASLMGKRNFQRFGNSFPLLVKIIDAERDLSVQVHPDDETARRHGHPNGKNEMWYVLASGKNVRIADGLKPEVGPDNIDKILAEDKIEEELNFIDIAKGDVYYIPAGRVHSLGAGSMVVEIQQSSDLTYRLYDYHRVDASGKERQLHIDLAREAIRYTSEQPKREEFVVRMDVPTTVIRTPEFTTNILVTETEVIRDYSELDTFVVLICTEGEADVSCGEQTYRLKRGCTVLVPAESLGVRIAPAKKAIILETYVG